jgi:hypothetical protein
MLDTENLEQRFVETPDGKGWMFGFDEKNRVTVHFAPAGKSKVGTDKSFDISECEEVEERKQLDSLLTNSTNG